MACRGCKFYDVESVKDAGGRIRKNRVARCLWVMPDIAWPVSITTSHTGTPKPNFRHMEPDEGADCPAFVAA